MLKHSYCFGDMTWVTSCNAFLKFFVPPFFCPAPNLMGYLEFGVFMINFETIPRATIYAGSIC